MNEPSKRESLARRPRPWTMELATLLRKHGEKMEKMKNSRGNPFKRGMSGNPAGRPPGARNKTTLAAEKLLDGQAQQLTDKAIELALAGDLGALRLCLERILPPRRDRPIRIDLPALKDTDDAAEAISVIVAAVASAQITLGEAFELTKLVDMFVTARAAVDKSVDAGLNRAWVERGRKIQRDRSEHHAKTTKFYRRIDGMPP